MTTAPPVILYKADTTWGAGQTTCFVCDEPFTYPIGEKVAAIRAPQLCDQGCKPGTHKGNCTAFGGDLCPNCARQANDDPAAFVINLAVSTHRHERRAHQLTAYASAYAASITPATEF